MGCVAAAFGICGAVDALAASEPGSLPGSLLPGVSAGCVLGLVVALPLVGCVALARRAFSGTLTQMRSEDPEPMLRAHTGFVLAVVAIAIIAVATSVASVALRRIQIPELATQLQVLATVFATTLAIALAAVAAPWAHGLVRRAHAAVGLPRPRNAGVRLFLFLVVPGALLSWRVASRFEADLPSLMPVVFLFAGAGTAVSLIVALHHGKWRHFPTAQLAALVIAVALAGASPVTLAATESVPEAPFTQAVVAGLKSVTDFDGDGYSGYFGGGDCAPFDEDIHPLQHDTGRDGVDQDCDGSDGLTIGPAHRSATLYGQLPSKRVRRYNVLWVIIDAVRADQIWPVGSGKAAPHLKRFARHAWAFTRARSQSSQTLISVPSMLTGKDPGAMSWTKQRRKLVAAPEEVMIGERLRDEGYATGAVVSKYLLDRDGAIQGHEWMRHTWLRGWRERGSPVSASRAIDFLHSDPAILAGKKPFFLTLYFEDPHRSYVQQGPDLKRFGKGPKARYRSEIAFSDRYVEVVLNYLKTKRRLWKNTIVIVTADHGEEFGEHGGKSHGRTCYEEVDHVPLVVRIPGFKPKRVKQPVALIDVVPTLVELIGLKAGAAELDGRSLLVPALSPDKAADRELFCTVWNQGSVGKHSFVKRAIRSSAGHFIQDLVGGTVEFYGPGDEHDETENSSALAPERLQNLRVRARQSLTGNLFAARRAL